MYNVIANPQAGEGKKKKLLERAPARFAERGKQVRLYQTEKPGDAAAFAAKLSREGEGDIVAFGGDGTLHEVLKGFENFGSCALGLIPAGTGNDFAASAGIPLQPEAAADLIADTQPQFTDFLQLPQGVRGINAAGTGIDVEILRRCRDSKFLRGKMQYLVSLIVSLIKYKNYTFTVRVNGQESRHSALIACVGNGQTIGGGIRMCPQAHIADGMLDFVAVDDVKKASIPAAFVKLMKGRILEEPFTFFERCKHVEIEPDAPMTVQVDGELYDGLPFIADIVENKLRMWRGAPQTV